MDAELSELLTARCSPLVERVEAEFIRRKDFCYAWRIQNRQARIQISDYLQGAPEDVLVDFGEMVVVRGLKRKWTIPDSFKSFVDSEEFIVSRRPTFIQRSRNLMRTDMGEHSFIPDSVQRLLDSGLLLPSDIENSWFSWTRRDNFRRLGFCSTLFRVVGISSILDSPDIPDDLLDYVVYHECLHLRQGYRPDRRSHDAEFRAWEHAYPGWKGCEDRLRRLRDDRIGPKLSIGAVD